MEIYFYRYFDVKGKRPVLVDRLFPSHRAMRKAYPKAYNCLCDMVYFDGNGDISQVFHCCTMLSGQYYYGFDLDFERFTLSKFSRFVDSSCFLFASQ